MTLYFIQEIPIPQDTGWKIHAETRRDYCILRKRLPIMPLKLKLKRTGTVSILFLGTDLYGPEQCSVSRLSGFTLVSVKLFMLLALFFELLHTSRSTQHMLLYLLRIGRSTVVELTIRAANGQLAESTLEQFSRI